MKATDKRIVWKEKNDLELLLLINRFIDSHGISTVRDYQKKIEDSAERMPSLWLINSRFGSWDSMLKSLGKKPYERYKWDTYSDNELKEIVSIFISENKIRSQRKYEKLNVGKNVPSLSTLKKRFGDVRSFFKVDQEADLNSFQMLTLLKEEILNLGLETTLSRTTFEKLYNRSIMPSPSTIIRKTGKTWEELMETLGFNYREIKVERISRNLKQNRK
ncbi:hypothetical protein [Enterococcus casseliflavus]|uniref:hypothetical protein n=1 Tax=Enterococcus casseliflavus TaxID=37734 RepID=UPI003D0A8081